MTASSSSEAVLKSLPNNSSPRTSFNAVAHRDSLIARATVTYAPLPVWRDSHWICSLTSVAPLMQERLE
jgi:hypothetical protein